MPQQQSVKLCAIIVQTNSDAPHLFNLGRIVPVFICIYLFYFILFSYSNLVFYHPVFMRTLKYRIRDEWWKRQKELKMYFAQKVFMLSSGGV